MKIGTSRPRMTFCPEPLENAGSPLLRVIFVICVLCFAFAIYSGHRIVSETHFARSDEPSRVPGASKSPYRDNIATLEQAQRIRASRLAAGTHPPSKLDSIMDALGVR